MQATRSTLLALDVGTKRIGVALSDLSVRLPHPLTTLQAENDPMQQVGDLASRESAVGLVIGLPRGLDGQETAQTQLVRSFAEELKAHVDLPQYWQDEAVTSRQAEEELKSRGKPYQKGDIDALSATYILEDFLRDNPEVTA
ncbi:MAG TPA: Holliday junction resolvase RuvX [Candidatus Saccharimonadales bacterium]|nr:Holliday junction resolvase RuvX [Candidatus Saccharimonadales bacterium]